MSEKQYARRRREGRGGGFDITKFEIVPTV